MGKSSIFTAIQFGGQTSAYETEAATTEELKGKILSFTSINENSLIKERGLGDGRNVTNTLYGPYNCGGSIVWHPAAFDFLKYWIGPMTGAGTAGDPYLLTEDNIVGLTTDDIQVFSLEVNIPKGTTDDVDTYIGCVGNSFSISGSIGGPVTVSADFLARHVVSSTSGTAYTPTTTNPWMMHQGTWKWGSSPTAFTGLQSFNINYSNNLIDERDSNSRFRQQPIADGRDYNFSITVITTASINTTLRDDFYGQADTPIAGVVSASPTPNLEFEVVLSEGSSSTNRNATIWLDNAAVDSIGKPVSLGGELVIYTISGHAKSGRSSTPIKWWTVA